MNERDIFHAAVELTDGAERAAFLEKVCAGNASLKQDVEALLQVYPDLGTFLESPAVDWQSPARPPVRAGRFQLGPELARGGMGVVYWARDESLGRDARLGRDVAVKVLKDELSGRPNLVRRFIEEAQVASQPTSNTGGMPGCWSWAVMRASSTKRCLTRESAR